MNTIEAHNKNARLLLDDGSSSSVVPEALSQYASVIWPASDDGGGSFEVRRATLAGGIGGGG